MARNLELTANKTVNLASLKDAYHSG